MGLSTIQWCRYTFNAWLGCRKVAPECLNCYITSTPTFKFRGLTHGPVRVRTAESTWKQPLAWDRKAAREGVRERVFSLSLGDWLDDENVPIEWFSDLLKLIQDTPHLDWLLLTKRPQNWRGRLAEAITACKPTPCRCGPMVEWLDGNPPANVWIGVSAGADQSAALDIPARVHFLSCEPMLRPIDRQRDRIGAFDWAIFGGESGKKARPCNIDWIRDAMKFCREFKVAPFVKQLGSTVLFTDKGAPGGTTFVGKLKDSHGGDMDEWPEDLRIREFPDTRTGMPG